MDSPPPLETKQKPDGFRLPLAAWIVLAIYVVLQIAMFPPGTDSSYRIGEFIGGLVASFLIPAALALLVWRISGRSDRAGTITFFVVFGLVVLSKFSAVANHAATAAAVDEMNQNAEKYREAQKEAMAKGQKLDAGTAKQFVDRTNQRLGELKQSASGTDRVALECMQDFTAQASVALEHYQKTLAALDVAHFFQLEQYHPGGVGGRNRQAVRAFDAAAHEMAALQAEDGHALAEVMRAHQLPEAEIRQALDGWRRHGAERRAVLRQIRESEFQFARALGDFVDFAEKNYNAGKRGADGVLRFPNAATADTFNAIMTRVRTAGAEQKRLQKQAIEMH